MTPWAGIAYPVALASSLQDIVGEFGVRRRIVTLVLALTSWGAGVSCDGDVPGGSGQGEVLSADRDAGTASPTMALPPQVAVTLGAHRPNELLDAATDVVRFLRGEVGFGRVRLADTVGLFLAPEGSGTRRKVAGDILRNRSSWKVRPSGAAGARGFEYSLVPPEGRAELTTQIGRHFRCSEQPLSMIFAELASLPHVGTMLKYGESCLQTWNLTLVFDPGKKPPTVVAAVYDQFEW